MSLKWYRRPRLVVLNEQTPVRDAARALENNNIGAVLVQHQGAPVGIVTDRDLAVRVLGRDLDPRTTTLRDVMTMPVMVLSPADEQMEAIRLMRERNVRRIPLVEGERIVGIVTLDDLLLDEAVPLEEVASVVEAQIGAGGPAPSVATPARQRRAARAESTYRRLVNQVAANAGLEAAEAETALGVVVGALVRRLTRDEAKDLIAQLPSLMQPSLSRVPPGPDKLITKASIEAELSRALNVDVSRAGAILSAVGATLAQTVSAGQIRDVRSQLPEDLSRIFEEGAVADVA